MIILSSVSLLYFYFLILRILGENISREQFKVFFLFFPGNRLWYFSVFFGKIRKNIISLSSAVTMYIIYLWVDNEMYFIPMYICADILNTCVPN